MPQINKPSDYFNTILWTGNGTNPRSLTGVGFQPDLVWEKNRDDLVDPTGQNFLYDSVRGAGAEKELISNATLAEGANANQNFGYINSFDSDGFTANAGATNNYYFNKSSARYVAWNWLAGGTASSNTDGSITSSVSANTTSGFSIVSYTGTGSASDTVGHGLGVAPKMIILKRRNASDAWYVMHTSLTSNNNVFLNLTDAQQNVSTYTAGLISTSPTSSVFSFVNGTTVNNVNASGGTYIAYCFAEKKGFSKFSSYVGNGSSDGVFCYTGFKPAWVMIKQSSASGEGWHIYDNKRETYNPNDIYGIRANSTSGDLSDSTLAIDMLSNGFKIRGNGSGLNASGATYIYMCFSESPLVGTNNTPATAR